MLDSKLWGTFGLQEAGAGLTTGNFGFEKIGYAPARILLRENERFFLMFSVASKRAFLRSCKGGGALRSNLFRGHGRIDRGFRPFRFHRPHEFQNDNIKVRGIFNKSSVCFSENSDKEPATPTAEPPAIVKYAPGIALALCVSEASFLVAGELGKGLLSMQGIENVASSPISGIPVAIMIGLVLGNTLKLPTATSAGLKFSTTTILRAGIICVGAKLSAVELMSGGLVGIPAVLLSVGTGLAFVQWFGKKMDLPPRMSSLIAAGTSICGVTAITAVAPAIKAKPEEVSYAVANVVAFGTCGLLVYPYLAHAIFDNSQQIGMWLGMAIHDTSQVIGSALTYHEVYDDEVVLKAATITKLTRNVLLAGVIPTLAYTHAKAGAGSNQSADGIEAPKLTLSLVKKYIPTFVYGFIGMACLRSIGDVTLASNGAALGVLDGQEWKDLVKFTGGYFGSHVCLGTAMAAVGMSTDISILRKGNLGIRPFVVGMTGSLVLGATGFCSVTGLNYLGLLG